jgi:PAS domain-containing protein
MNQFFGTQYSQEDLQQRLAERRRSNAPSRANSSSMGPGTHQQGTDDAMDMMMGGGDSLDDIIMQNNQELQRRQSLPMAYSRDIDRRSSMMEFASSDQNLGPFQFGASTSMSGDSNLRRQSTGELDIAGAYGNMANMGPGMSMPGQAMAYSSAMVSDPLLIDTNAQYSGMSADMVHGMMGYGPMGGMEGISEEDSTAMNMFSPASYSQPYGAGTMDSMTNDFMMPQNLQDGLTPHRDSIVPEETEEMMPVMPAMSVADPSMVNSPQTMSISQSMAYSSPVTTNMPQESAFNAPTGPSPPTDDSQSIVKLEKKPDYSGIYSTSGFDMLGALMKVANRKNPEVNLGKVDLSCAFVVCDITMYDCPIIYISEIFERLTGYTKHEIIGQNCRFLQDPNGKVQAGAYRNFVNNDSVYYLRQRIEARKEAQQSIINYRKGGQPFMNMLSMVPITGEDDKEIRYIVGFQVDLMLKPEALAAKGVSGLYTVDYSQENLPKYIWQAPEPNRPRDGGQTISRDDVSQVLSSINTSLESELTKRMWDKVLLENTDDVVHVLSLKGLFLYLSPSSRHVLEYDSSELVGTALSSVCHPSDIVPVTRELKDTSAGASVNVVFRIRRKKSGYTWFESHGSLCVEQGKGRKCIILVGRERPVYALARHDVEAAGGIGDSEMWTKLSTSGMFLFVSSNVRTLLDRSPDDLVGTSIQALMRPESKVEFGRSLEKARTGKRVTHKHEILNKRGLVLQAQTTLYPGDAAEGQKPTFLVAQTRLLKSSSRNVAPALISHNSGSSKGISSVHPSDGSTPLGHPPGLSSGAAPDGSSPTSTQMVPSQMIGAVTQAGGPRLPIGSQDLILASEDNIFDELKTTRCTSWQFELRQMEKSNRILAEELAALLQNKKKRKRRKGGSTTRDCANCHTRVTPEWRRGPSGNRDLCNSCGLRWAKQVSGRTSDHSGTVRRSSYKGLSQSDSSTSRS